MGREDRGIPVEIATHFRRDLDCKSEQGAQHLMNCQMHDLVAAVESERKLEDFTTEMQEASRELLALGQTGDLEKEDRQREIIATWIRENQPCLFGRLAATKRALGICILNEADISNGDEAILLKIQHERRRWRRQALKGKQSGFIIAVISARICLAHCDERLAMIARRLCDLYLRLDVVNMDEIYHEQVLLEIQNSDDSLWMWKAGVNYFSSQGDGRWWQDHRFPGGMALSVNSVGHMVAARKLSEARGEIDKLFPPLEQISTLNLKSLSDALRMAMQTIAGASPTVSGRATELLPLSTEDTKTFGPCPFSPAPPLANKSYVRYRGYYHTDVTLPSVYFRPEFKRPTELLPFDDLDFTYLFHKQTSNPPYETMGTGIPVSEDDLNCVRPMPKGSKADAVLVRRSDVEHLF